MEHGEIIHVAGKVDPLADIEIIDTELILADLDTVEKACNPYHACCQRGEAIARKSVLERLQVALNEGKSARSAGLDEDERALVRDLFLLTLKPVMYIANVLENGFQDNVYLEALRVRASSDNAQLVPISAVIEEELAQLEDVDRDAFLVDLGLEEPGLNRVVRAAYALLGLQTCLLRVKEVRAWTVKSGATAPQASCGDSYGF